jgi:hypothetical protein
MRRSLATALLALVGLVLLADQVVANPTLGSFAGWLTHLVVLLTAAIAVGGALALVVRHVGRLGRGEDSVGSAAVLVGLGLVLLPGLVPGSDGAATPAVRWMVAALLAPLVAAVFSLLFPLLLLAAQRGLRFRGRETAVMLMGACAVLILLLPLGGAPGAFLASLAGWVQGVPVAAVFRGLLVGVAVLGAVTAARILLGSDGAYD